MIKEYFGISGNFPRGEWTNEPDYARWEHVGLQCTIKRIAHMGNLCGYVDIPKDHLLYGMHYDDKELSGINVHGGLTFASHEEGGDKYRFGFDCAHAGDYIPAYDEKGFLQHDDIYRNFEYVKQQVESLAEQLKELENK